MDGDSINLRGQDLRVHRRDIVQREVQVNRGKPYEGGIVYDLSVGGMSIHYPPGTKPDGPPLQPGEIIFLSLDDKSLVGSVIVRVWDGGFAIEYDWSLTPPNKTGGRLPICGTTQFEQKKNP